LLRLILFAALIFVSACGLPYGVYHTVKNGQTLYNIARVYNVPLRTIENANNITNDTDLKPGEKIFIPGAEKVMYVSPTIKTGHSNRQKTVQITGRTKPSNLKKHRERHKTVRHSTSAISFVWPLRGKIIQTFNTSNGNRHDGIDIKAPEGKSIRAAASGTVIYSNDTIRGYGSMIIIKHKKGFVTVYAHNSVNLVKKGRRVKQGEVIAKVGDTGYATTPHLHFEVRLHAIPKNPLKYLP